MFYMKHVVNEGTVSRKLVLNEKEPVLGLGKKVKFL